jgi:hypothetical protein
MPIAQPFDPSWFSILFILFLFLSCICSVAFQIYGTVVCFRKKWYMGLAALAVPGFSLVIGVAKLFFKKDLLK